MLMQHYPFIYKIEYNFNEQTKIITNDDSIHKKKPSH